MGTASDLPTCRVCGNEHHGTCLAYLNAKRAHANYTAAALDRVKPRLTGTLHLPKKPKANGVTKPVTDKQPVTDTTMESHGTQAVTVGAVPAASTLSNKERQAVYRAKHREATKTKDRERKAIQRAKAKG